MFPRLSAMGLELWFRSIWYGQDVVLMEVDGLVPCPAGQLWPFCRWCRKFHLPYDGSGSHRQSKQHTHFREYYLKPALKDPTGDSVKKLRESVIEWSRDVKMFM